MARQRRNSRVSGKFSQSRRSLTARKPRQRRIGHTYETKMEAARRLEAGVPLNDVAASLGVPRETLRRKKKIWSKLLVDRPSTSASRCRTRLSMDPAFESSLVAVVKKGIAERSPLMHPSNICQYAAEVAARRVVVDGKKFPTFDYSWLSRFTARNDLTISRRKAIAAEVDVENAKKFQATVAALTNGIPRCHLYNTDESIHEYLSPASCSTKYVTSEDAPAPSIMAAKPSARAGVLPFVASLRATSFTISGFTMAVAAVR